MKKIKMGIVILAILVLLYVQVIGDKNIYVTVTAVVIFMYGMMQLSAKIPSKNQEKKDEDDE